MERRTPRWTRRSPGRALPVLLLAFLLVAAWPGPDGAAGPVSTQTFKLPGPLHGASYVYHQDLVHLFGGEAVPTGGGADATAVQARKEIVTVDVRTGQSARSVVPLAGQAYLAPAVWDATSRPEQGCPQGCAFIFGAMSDADAADIVRFDPVRGVSSPVALFPPGDHATAVWDARPRPNTTCDTGCAYTFGGAKAPTAIRIFDPSGGALLPANAELPSPRLDAVAVWAGDAAYVFGGRVGTWGSPVVDATPFLDRIVRFNPEADSIDVMAPRLPTERWGSVAFWDARDRPDAGCPDGCVYILGGAETRRNATGALIPSFTNGILRYNPTQDRLVEYHTRLPQAVGYAAAAWTGNYSYLLGGLRLHSSGSVVPTDQIVLFDPVENDPPRAQLQFSNGTAPAGVPIFFNGTTSVDIDGRIVAYKWDFGDGKAGYSPAMDHAFKRPGDFTVSLTVVDERDGEHTDSVLVRILEPVDATTTPTTTSSSTSYGGQNRAPQASLALFQNGLQVEVDASASWDPDGDPIFFDWTWGDGGRDTGARVKHRYSTAGTYRLVLRVTDGFGLTDEFSLMIEADPSKTAQPPPSPTPTRSADVGSTDPESTEDTGLGADFEEAEPKARKGSPHLSALALVTLLAAVALLVRRRAG